MRSRFVDIGGIVDFHCFKVLFLMLNCSPNSTKLCSGRGRCICGTCECKSRSENSPEKYSGKWCQCDAYSCPFYSNALCGGNYIRCYVINAIGKPRVSPLLPLNTSAVIRYLTCVYASHFFAGRPYHFNQTLRTANKLYNGDNRWVCFEKYWSLMKVRNQPTLRRMKIYYYWTNIRKWNYFNTSFIEDFRK
jgi:hypothetical protein